MDSIREQAGSAGRLCLFQAALEREVKEYLNENKTAPRVTSISPRGCPLGGDYIKS
jgi:hypothetical protein